MSSKQSIADFVLEQIAGAGPVAARKMFGEFGVYVGAKVVALITDDELFVKPTVAGKAYLGEGGVDLRPPYPGAKPYFWISGDRWDDRDWLVGLIRATADELPVPPPKRAKAAKPAKPKPKPNAATTRATRKPRR